MTSAIRSVRSETGEDIASYSSPPAPPPEIISEAEAVATRLSNGVTRLDVDWRAALPRLTDLGRVRIVTSNPVVEHRKTGRFGNVHTSHDTALVLNREIDLRIELNQWRYTFLDTESASIRIFDAEGGAVHAIHRTSETNPAAWDAFVASCISADQDPALTILPPPPPDIQRSYNAVDVDALRTGWTALTDVHQFAPMLRQLNLSRQQAMHLAGTPWARKVPAYGLTALLLAAAAEEVPIMIFVSSSGCTQIHTGLVRKVIATCDWIEVADPGFILRVRRADVARAWVVKKPIAQGEITTLEIYDRGGECRAIVCGQRDRGQPERREWAELAAAIPSAPTL